MTIIVKKVTQLISGLTFMFGIYIITHGHLTPGGGFAGGVIIAGALFLVILCYGSEYIMIKEEKEISAVIESFALLIFLILPGIGIVIGSGIFFWNYLPLGIPGSIISSGIIPIYNLLIGLEVSAALISIILSFIIYKEEANP